MGLETTEFGRPVYLNISNGKVASKNAQGEKQFNTGITGHLIGHRYREGEDAKYGPELHIAIRDEGQHYVLQMRLDSGYAMSLMKALPNVDLTKPVTLAPWMSVKNDIKRSGMNVLQDGKEVQWAFTREHPNGLPEARFTTPSGEEKFDKQVHVNFLRKMMDTDIAPKMKDANEFGLGGLPAAAAPAALPQHIEDAPPADGEEDLPF